MLVVLKKRIVNFQLRSGKQTNSLHVRDRVVACLNRFLLEFTTRKLPRFVLKISKILKFYGFKLKSAIDQHFKEISTLKNNINRSKNEAKNLQISWIYETLVVDLPCLLFTKN